MPSLGVRSPSMWGSMHRQFLLVDFVYILIQIIIENIYCSHKDLGDKLFATKPRYVAQRCILLLSFLLDLLLFPPERKLALHISVRCIDSADGRFSSTSLFWNTQDSINLMYS